MDAIDLLRFLAGLALLIVGGEFLVRGASRIAGMAGISPIIIGLTVVAFGTSAPELAVSIQSAWGGNADIALGNVVGSNICNVLLILGLSALISRLSVDRRLVQRDVPIMIAISLGLFLLALDRRVSRIDGAILVAGLIIYIMILVRIARRESPLHDRATDTAFDDIATNEKSPSTGMALPILQVVGGLGVLVVGADWLVESAVNVASTLGVSSLVIGLTIVAGGTSLPELATSIIAAIRGQRDIAVGNVVGSNILNILSVLGITSMVASGGVAVPTSAIRFDIPIMLAVAIACLPIFFTGHCIERWEGAVFFSYYVAYTLYLLLEAAEHDALATYETGMLYFVIPLTVLTIGVVLTRSLKGRKQSSPTASH